MFSNHTCCSQDEGNRFYLNSQVVLKSEQIRKLSAMRNSTEYDSKYVGYLLSIVFGDNILRISSAKGSASHFNSVRHVQLDPVKLSIVESMWLDFQFCKISWNIDFGFFLILTEFYDDRVGGDSARKKSFWKFINKKCNNVRRGN